MTQAGLRWNTVCHLLITPSLQASNSSLQASISDAHVQESFPTLTHQGSIAFKTKDELEFKFEVPWPGLYNVVIYTVEPAPKKARKVKTVSDIMVSGGAMLLA